MPTICSRACTLPSASAASTSSTPPIVPPVLRCTTASMTAAMPGKFNRRSRNACTATSLAALSTTGWSPPARAAGCARGGSREVDPPVLEQVEEFYTGADSLGPRERVSDRRAHVRRGQLREHRTVDVFDQGMHDALRVHEDLHLCGRQAEQQARLDELQPLVHERGTVHGDLAAHDPVGMREGGFRSDGVERLARGVAERPAGGGEQYALQPRWRHPRDHTPRQ